jgi:hypothetical protein
MSSSVALFTSGIVPRVERHQRRQVRFEERPVVVGQPTDLLFGLLAFGDVPGVGHHTSDDRVVEEVAACHLDVAPGAVLVPKPELYRRLDSPGVVQSLGERAPYPLDVLRVHVFKCARP